MNGKIETKAVHTCLLGVVPWKNNRYGGATGIYEEFYADGSRKVRSETIYLDDLTAEEQLAVEIGVCALAVLRPRFEVKR